MLFVFCEQSGVSGLSGIFTIKAVFKVVMLL